MPNTGISQRLRSLRARVRELLIDARWYAMVAINRRIDQWAYDWREKNRNRE